MRRCTVLSVPDRRSTANWRAQDAWGTNSGCTVVLRSIEITSGDFQIQNSPQVLAADRLGGGSSAPDRGPPPHKFISGHPIPPPGTARLRRRCPQLPPSTLWVCECLSLPWHLLAHALCVCMCGTVISSVSFMCLYVRQVVGVFSWQLVLCLDMLALLKCDVMPSMNTSELDFPHL